MLEGLRALTRPVEVVVHTDSAYVQRAFDDGWLERWQRNGWRTSAKKPVENRDLWEAILEAARPHTVRFERVRGHAGRRAQRARRRARGRGGARRGAARLTPNRRRLRANGYTAAVSSS